MIFLTFFIVPLLICIVSWIFTNKISWKEVIAQLIVQALLTGTMVFIMLSSNMSDTEIWNGFVTEKKRLKVSCEHSYQCNCVNHTSCSGSGKSRSCTTTRICQTCYRHSYDVDWRVYNNINETWNISRLDSQGLKEPPRWTSVNVGDPTSSKHSYDNYIKGSPDSLFKTGMQDSLYKEYLPPYPSNIYDYYNLDRLVLIGKSIPNIDKPKWDKSISKVSAELGSIKQVNLVVVVTDLPQDYFQVLNKHWLGGKKNDAIPVIGIDSELNILWVEVMSLSNEEFKIHLRNNLLEDLKLDLDKNLGTIKKVVESHYIRRPMKDFEYLKSSIQPTMSQWVFGMILSILFSIGLSLFFYYQDPFGDENKFRIRRY